jgi:2-methylaconitate cis-trans-isomerase PrpF
MRCSPLWGLACTGKEVTVLQGSETLQIASQIKMKVQQKRAAAQIKMNMQKHCKWQAESRRRPKNIVNSTPNQNEDTQTRQIAAQMKMKMQQYCKYQPK